MNRRAFLLLILYAAFCLAPAVHELEHLHGPNASLALAHDAHELHDAHTASGPQLSVPCQGPCENPTHHHGPAHDKDHCTVCQVLRVGAAAPLPSVIVSTSDSVSTSAAPAALEPRSLADVRFEPARAPPADQTA